MRTITELKGRINDIDTHMAIPAKLWGQEFGEAGARTAAIFMEGLIGAAGVSEAIDIDQDDTPLDGQSLSMVKGCAAPGAIDTARRMQVLEMLGVDRSLVFPNGLGLIGLFFSSGTRASVLEQFPRMDFDSMDVSGLGREVIREYNNWALRKNDEHPGRLRFVGIVLTESLDEMMSEAQRLIDGGIGALLISSSIPPGGKSPADPALDVFWDMAARSRTPVVFHVGGEGGFMRTRAWRQNVENFEYKNVDTLELTVEPYTLATNYYAPSNYLTTMVFGGVFERHPDLRVGAMELAANWVGPLADNLDVWSSCLPQFKRVFDKALSMRPSEYLVRNLRVSPFYFEPVDEYLNRYGHLEDVYAFATDYPHREGGTSPIMDQWERVAPFGATTVEKFFSRNGALLLPDLGTSHAAA